MKDLFNKLPHIKVLTAFILLIISVLFLAIAILMKPNTHYATYASDLENNIPKSFGEWTLAPEVASQVALVSGNNNLQDQIYDDVLMRTYVNKNGEKVMLALAYAKEQRQDIKVHQPDICYPAQGYQMLFSKNTNFNIAANGSSILGKNQLYAGTSHREVVSYWVRVGDATFLSGLQMRLKIIKDGLLKKRYDDGILVRVSSISQNEADIETLFKLHERFLNDLTASLSTNHLKLLVPTAI